VISESRPSACSNLAGGAGRRTIYLDHAASTPVRQEVLEVMLPYFGRTFGNPSSIHKVGQQAKRALEQARETVASCLGADPREICFTSGGTESNNLALKGVAHASGRAGRHLVTSAVEHHAVLNCCKYLEGEGYDVTYVPVDSSGVIDLAALGRAVRSDTVLISVMLVNNEVGTIQPLAEIAEMARARGVPLHTDAVQAVGRVPVDVRKLGVDLLTLSGHKLSGPKGIGALYVRTGTRIDPLIHGGHHENNRRAGTESVPSAVGLAKAFDLATKEMPQSPDRLRTLRDRLEQGIRKRLADARVNGNPEQRAPHILSMSFAGVEAESLLLTLDLQGIAVSAGSACTSGAVGPSHVLRAMGADLTQAQGSLRFSLGPDNTEEEIEFVIETVDSTVRRLRQVSPLLAGRNRG
jgi:cysteine desulfurase